MNAPTIIYRHRKENLKKCSLRGLEEREDFQFYSYPNEKLPNLSSYLCLKIGAPPLSEEDHEPIFLIDGTWRYAEKMGKMIDQPMKERSLPSGFMTAYPRRQTLCPNPSEGLASIEALYLAFLITKREHNFLLNNYPFKDEFLRKNNL